TPALVERLDDPDPDVRRQFAHVLGKLRDPSAVPTLVRLLSDADPGVAAKAAQSLGAVGGAEATAALVAALEGPDADPVVLALGAVGAAAVPPLVAALRSGSPTLRARAAEALGLIGNDEAATDLVAALSDDS